MTKLPNGIWFCYNCSSDCGETGWFLLPPNTGIGGHFSPAFTGYCPKGHETLIYGEDARKIWPSPIQVAPAWYPSKSR